MGCVWAFIQQVKVLRGKKPSSELTGDRTRKKECRETGFREMGERMNKQVHERMEGRTDRRRDSPRSHISGNRDAEPEGKPLKAGTRLCPDIRRPPNGESRGVKWGEQARAGETSGGEQGS